MSAVSLALLAILALLLFRAGRTARSAWMSGSFMTLSMILALASLYYAV